MRLLRPRGLGLTLAGLLLASSAWANGFSTSITAPTPVPATGIITGSYPVGGAETSYYFAVDLKAGDLVAQMSVLGRPGRDKKIEFDLLDPKGKRAGSFWMSAGLDANDEAGRTIPIDSSGRYTVRLNLAGPETSSFRLELGGSALPSRQAAAEPAAPFSHTYLAPTPLPKDGVIAGTFPGGDKVYTYYYFAADLKAGDLLSQISFAGRPNAAKWMQLEVLDTRGKTAAWRYIMGEGANGDGTKSFPIDSSGRHVLRVSVKGAEGTKFKVELGGSSLGM